MTTRRAPKRFAALVALIAVATFTVAGSASAAEAVEPPTAGLLGCADTCHVETNPGARRCPGGCRDD